MTLHDNQQNSFGRFMDDVTDVEKNIDEKEEESSYVVENGKLQESLRASLSPLLNSMRLGGQYFKRFSQPRPTCSENTKQLESFWSKWTHRIGVAYPTIVTIVSWMNAIRMLGVFTSKDTSPPQLLGRSLSVTFQVQIAIQQTAFFYASMTGKLDQVLDGLIVGGEPHDFYRRTRRLAMKFTVVTWVIVVANQIFFAYIIFFTDSLGDLLLAPFGTHIYLSDMTPVRVGYVVASLNQNASEYFTIAMNLFLSIVLSDQFRKVDARLCATIGSSKGICDLEIEEIREQHQTLYNLVEQADSFLKFYNVAAFFGPLASAIVEMYILVFYPSTFGCRKLLWAMWSVWLATRFIQLLITSVGGILVNHTVNVFLNRTSGASIGFTVLGMMTIDRNALITLLGLLVTYFLLVMQFPVSKNEIIDCSMATPNVTMSTTAPF